MESRQLFINYLIKSCERSGAEKTKELYDEIINFIHSSKGLVAFESFKKSKITPVKVSGPRHIKEVLDDMALNKKRQSNMVDHP